MAATLMKGGELAARVRARVADDVRELGQLGLATILVGDDPASHLYIRKKHEAARDVGIAPTDHWVAAETQEDELLALVTELNTDDEVDGLLIQLPLPPHLDEARVIRALDPMKDVDGLHPFNAGQLFLGRPTHVGGTPVGIMTMLEHHGVEVEGKRAVVVGRSDIVGKPIALLLLHANATVTLCHSRTADLAEHTREADVLVVAAGRAGIVTADMVKDGAAVVDVGITRTDDGIVGDVDPGAAERAAFITPVPGGVGPMTVATLLANTVLAARYRRGLLAFPRG